MSEIVPGSDVSREGTDDPRSGVAVAEAGAGLPVRFDNPGLPPEHVRLTDIDQKAARRAELGISALFGVSALGTVITIVGYFLIRLNEPTAGDLRTSNTLLGTGLFLTLTCIGIGIIQWARALMADHDLVEQRHPASDPEVRAAAAAALELGLEESGIRRRPLILASLGGALALAPLPALVLLKDLGPNPGNKLRETVWTEGMRIVQDPTGRPIQLSELEIGGVAHVLPEVLSSYQRAEEQGLEYLDEKAKAAVLLIRLEEGEVPEAARAGSIGGLVAYSKICTHMGCSVALYEQVTHRLLCPCHQSTFNVLNHCEVIFGPADRALPQLPIGVDGEGYLIATAGFAEPVGPSFWERGPTP